MAILGGALAPMVHGAVMDQAGPAMGYVVPGVCLALVGAYALFDLRNERPAISSDAVISASGGVMP
jgi:FHS family L-fucose permease-like MFS transporter